jgi:type I restriction-modification system DNA methylase subunit
MDKRETVMDSVCGTGGFLTAAIDYFRNQLEIHSSTAEKRAIEALIYGIEKLLKENGRAAVVLPDGFLFGDGIKGELKICCCAIASCTLSFACPRAYSRLTPPSRPAVLHQRCGVGQWHRAFP